MNRIADYKNCGQTPETLRYKHTEITVRLRKNKRNDALQRNRSCLIRDDHDFFCMEEIAEVLDKMRSGADAESLHSCISELIMFLSEGKEIAYHKIDILIGFGALPILVSLLEHKVEEVRDASLHALGFIASGSDEQVRVLLSYLPLMYLSAFLTNPKAESRAYAVRFLLNATQHKVAVDAVYHCSLLIPLIFKNLETDELNIQMDVVWILENIAKSPYRIHILAQQSEEKIPLLCRLLSTCKDNYSMLKILLVLNRFLRFSTNLFKIMEQCGCLDQITNLQFHENPKIADLAQEIYDKFEIHLREI